VSLELVGEVFEVRTQVDRDLTIVSRVDRRLGLIQNLGRHTRGVVEEVVAEEEEAAVLASPPHLAREGGRGRVGEAAPGERSRPPSGGARGHRREEHEAAAVRLPLPLPLAGSPCAALAGSPPAAAA
jgi:hypothetical protein